MTDKTPEQIIIDEWRAKDTTLVGAVREAMTPAWFPQTDIEYAMQEEIDTLRAEVERLRNHPYGYMINERDVTIDTLRAENERLVEEVGDWKANYNKATDACVALRAENDRLRGALERALPYITSNEHEQIARAALSKQGE